MLHLAILLTSVELQLPKGPFSWCFTDLATASVASLHLVLHLSLPHSFYKYLSHSTHLPHFFSTCFLLSFIKIFACLLFSITHTPAFAHTRTHTHTHAHTRTHMSTQMNTHTHAHTRTYTHIHAYTWTHTRTCAVSTLFLLPHYDRDLSSQLLFGQPAFCHTSLPLPPEPSKLRWK